MPQWTPAKSMPRMSSPRSLLALWALAPKIQALWEASARHEATYIEAPDIAADERGGLDPLEEEVYRSQAEQFVRKVAGRPETGMTWRLSFMEAEMGLPDGDMLGMTDDQRRDRICSRIRSWRLPTVQAVRLVAQAYAGNDVQVSVDYERHLMTVRFVGHSLPENLTALQAEIIRMVPARLGIISWVVAFLTWGDCDQSTVTWCQIEAAGWTWEQFEQALPPDLPIGLACT